MSGVLSDLTIQQAVDRDELIVGGTFKCTSLKPASYEVTIAGRGLITPSGKPIKPSPKGRVRKPVVLESGDTAMFSSEELFAMPPTITGNISIRNRLAGEGLMLLSGMLIDPGYGAKPGERRGCCLYLHVANIGREPIALRPGVDQIARIQFLHVDGAQSPDRGEIEHSLWHDQQQASLGFLTDLKQLKEDVERSDSRSGQVVLFGFVVLAAALIGAAFSTILAVVSNTELRNHLDAVWKVSPSEVSLVIGVPATLFVLMWGLREVCRVVVPWRRRRRDAAQSKAPS
jgi:deoxycytidine triphosphate deaminase